MPLLRGVHVNNLADPAAWAVVRAGRPALVKVVNPDEGTRQMRREVQPSVVIGRLVLDNVDLTPTPEIAAERWYRATVERMKALDGAVDLWEVPANEVYPGGQALSLYAAASAHYVKLAAADGLRCLVGNFSVGTPEVAEWYRFLPALQAAKKFGGALSLHEYGLPNDLGETWWVGRWRRLMDATPPDARVSVYLTEFGVDGGLERPPRPRASAGWRAYGLTGQQYAEWLTRATETEERYNGDGLLQGVCLFNAGDYAASQAWRSFDAADPALTAWLAAGPRDAPAPAPAPAPPPPAPVPAPPSEPGKRDTMRMLHPWPVEWSQLRDRAYDADGDQNAARNCNLACLTAFLHYAYGLNIPNDWLTQPLGLSYKGNTTIQQGVFLLRQFFGVECEVYGPGTAADKLRPVVEKAISRGYPAIVLCAGNGDTLKADTPHFMAAYGYDEAGVTLYDPWDGVARAFSWAAFEDLQLFAQAYVPLRRRDAQLSAW